MIRVLLAEDHKIVRQGTRMFLESMAVEVLGEATTGLEAVELARTLKPDVVIMDIHLPELTGVEERAVFVTKAKKFVFWF